jgi:hypothetical protein
MKSSPQMPLLHSILWIVGSCLVCSGVSYKLLQNYKNKTGKKPSQVVSYIVQTGFQKEALHSDYLAELLELSMDEPKLLASLDEKKAQQKLLSSPVIQEASFKKIEPNMVYIDYTVRRPLGWAADFINTAIDKDGYLFPVYPFFSPKKLPEIYLGTLGVQEALQEKTPSFEIPLKGKYTDLAFEVLDLMQQEGKDQFRVKKVDVSAAFAPTLGKREIVVTLENELQGVELYSVHFLRLSTKQFAKEIINYISLRPHLIEMDQQEALVGNRKFQERVIDLRVSQLAFID